MRRDNKPKKHDEEADTKKKRLNSATLTKEKPQYRLTQALNAENPGE